MEVITVADREYPPEPEYLDVVDAPDGHQCKQWSGEEPSPCENQAEFVVVYYASIREDDDRRDNFLACSECFQPPEDVDRTGEVATDGGAETVDLESLSTHDLVLEALYDLDDFDTEDGIHAIEIAEWVTDQTELSAADVHDAISYLEKRGGVYTPAPGEERYRRREPDLRRWSG